ncbi:aldo/keto reductase [Streptomyces sp. DSM 44915]|uniref:Aldo/keto reductase n=1 Tax=Streptomyces chisholmiae TaxID=3075540 RepID=A0ABU2JRB5_9ACTN|nr:aldo/keto reductase [Streptomyces sp. DSM 44915]MDT0267527.1 aldo/keto reductase [Streptomyces sp. DSM 44915]
MRPSRTAHPMPAERVDGLPLPLTRLALGTMTFGDTADESASAAMLDAALEAGVTVVDTANGYAGGESERIVGRLLAGRRDQVVLATKAGIPHPDAGAHSPLSPAGLRASVDGSLARLNTDRVDLFYLHQPDRAARLEDTLATVAELADAGKIGALGVSNYAAWQIGDVIRVAEETGAPRPVVAQQVYNLLARRLEDEYAEFATVHGVHTMVYNPLGGGLLTGRYRRDEAPTSGRFGDSRLSEMYRRRYWDERLFDALDRLALLADEAGLPLVELAYRWLFAREVTGSVLLGGSRVDQLRANLALAAAPPLDAELVAACDAVSAGLAGPAPAYNR